MTFLFKKLARFRKILRIALVLFLYSKICFGENSTLKTIAQTHALRIGYRTSSMPFSYLDENQNIVGYSIDLCRSIASAIQEKLGLHDLKISFIPITSQNRIMLLQSGAIDLDCGSTSNLKSRRRQADFSDSIFMAHTRMMVKVGSTISGFKSIGKRVVVISSGTSSDDTLSDFARNNNLKFNVIYGKDHANSFLLLITGRASAFINDDSILYGLRARLRSKASNFVILPDSLRAEPYAIMFRKNDPKFKKIINDTLEKIMKSGKILVLYNKWFMSPIPPKNTVIMMPLSDDTRRLFQQPNDDSADG